MFSITTHPIVPPSMECPGAGGFVSFVGKVRNEDGGRRVLKLEYEAYAAMAESEGTALLAEAVGRFGLLEARAIHRTGTLEVGETAVWIGVASPHRREAFAACEWIIDEIKRRVPIWKKEHFADGDSGWIGTDQAADRQPLSAVLAGSQPHTASGVQIAAVGPEDVARQVVAQLADPGVALTAVSEGLASETDWSAFDLVLHCSGSLDSALEVNDAVVRSGKTMVVARALGPEVHVLTVAPGGPCLRCLWPVLPWPRPPVSLPEGAHAQALVELVANEVSASLSGSVRNLSRRAVVCTVGSDRVLHLERSTAAFCTLGHGSEPAARILLEDWEVGSLAAARLLLGPIRTVDVREPEEHPEPLEGWQDGWEYVPMSRLEPASVSDGTPAVLVCRSGRRTAHLTHLLRGAGHSQVYSLAGGVLRAHTDG